MFFLAIYYVTPTLLTLTTSFAYYVLISIIIEIISIIFIAFSNTTSIIFNTIQAFINLL